MVIDRMMHIPHICRYVVFA